jgi:molybdopterin converting factor small subunit
VIKIVVPSVWTSEGRTTFEETEGPLHDVIKRLAAAHPGLRRRLLGPDAEPLKYINICVDDELIPRQQRPATTVKDGSTITVISPMAGG